MAEILEGLKLKGVNKHVLYGGEGNLSSFSDGSKATFHYRTCKCDEEKTVLDDSRTHEKPMELVFGKQFKLGIWETCLKSMKVKEVADFTVETKHVDNYSVVAKSLRDIYKKKHNHSHEDDKPHHCCGMMSMAEQGTGYPDLDDLIANPQPLTFTLELLSLESNYEKEAWEMDEGEKSDAIPRLQEEGNLLYKDKQYEKAAEKYAKAIGIIEQLLLREKPGDDPWVELNKRKHPLLLNFSQCKLLLKDYYPVIEHTSTVLQDDPDNVKALYRRGKAHIGAWNPDEARQDLTRVAELDQSLSATVKKELHLLAEMQRQKNIEDGAKLKGKLF